MPSSVARINLSVLAENIEHIRACLPEQLKITFAVKSNGYGHGIEAISRTAEQVGVDCLGAATVDEGVIVRRAGVKLPILLLGPIQPSEMRTALENDLCCQVSEVESPQLLSQLATRLGKKASVQVNVDTGMGRFGAAVDKTPLLMAELRDFPGLEVKGVFSHLSAADSEMPEDQSYTVAQIRRFTALLKELRRSDLLPPLRHIGNSAGLIQYKELVTSGDLNMVRIGTLFYGYLEVIRPWAQKVSPVATMITHVIALREAFRGDFVGYGKAYRCSRRRHLAVVPIGYGSGLNPKLASGGEMWVKGERAPIVGRLCLDYTIIDVSGISGVSIGDEVEVVGPHIPADHLAENTGLAVCEALVPTLNAAAKRIYQG